MCQYKIEDISTDNPFKKEGKATLEQLKELLPNYIFERLFISGTISIKQNAGHESYEITKVRINDCY